MPRLRLFHAILSGPNRARLALSGASFRAPARILSQDLNSQSRLRDRSIQISARGTRDYNIALGERRANAAKNYLATLGVDPGRINVISYGKERPAAVGSNEEAYAKNRRAVTVVIERP